MSFVLRISPAAHRDVVEAAEYIARDRIDAALRFLDRVDETYRLIREAPERWAEFRVEELAGLRRRMAVGSGVTR